MKQYEQHTAILSFLSVMKQYEQHTAILSFLGVMNQYVRAYSYSNLFRCYEADMNNIQLFQAF